MPASDLYNFARSHDVYKARKIRLQAQWNFKSQLSLRARLGNALINPPSPARCLRISKKLTSARRRRFGRLKHSSICCADTSQLRTSNQNRTLMVSSSQPRTTSAQAISLQHVPLPSCKASSLIKMRKLCKDFKAMEERLWW